MKTTKKKNPIDATLRNVRAANKRIKALEVRVRVLAEYLQRTSGMSPEGFDMHLSLVGSDLLAQKQDKK